jgi:hypothetical protein
MSFQLSTKFLNVPIYVWIAQITYVVIALGLFVLLIKIIKPNNLLMFEIIYVLAMIVINVVWRLLLQRTY